MCFRITITNSNYFQRHREIESSLARGTLEDRLDAVPCLHRHDRLDMNTSGRKIIETQVIVTWLVGGAGDRDCNFDGDGDGGCRDTKSRERKKSVYYHYS